MACIAGVEDVPLVGFMYLVFTRRPGELPQVFVVVFVSCISSAFWTKELLGLTPLHSTQKGRATSVLHTCCPCCLFSAATEACECTNCTRGSLTYYRQAAKCDGQVVLTSRLGDAPVRSHKLPRVRYLGSLLYHSLQGSLSALWLGRERGGWGVENGTKHTHTHTHTNAATKLTGVQKCGRKRHIFLPVSEMSSSFPYRTCWYGAGKARSISTNTPISVSSVGSFQLFLFLPSRALTSGFVCCRSSVHFTNISQK